MIKNFFKKIGAELKPIWNLIKTYWWAKTAGIILLAIATVLIVREILYY